MNAEIWGIDFSLFIRQMLIKYNDSLITTWTSVYMFSFNLNKLGQKAIFSNI